MLREKLRNRKGFTLIEIIVVIVILAVLMAVAVPSVMSYMNEGQKAKYESVARTVLINAQTEYAKAVADGKSDSDAKTLAATNSGSTNHNYGKDVEVTVSKITTTVGKTSSKAAEDYDVDTVTASIKIDNKIKIATIEANKKVSLADSNS